MRIVHTVEFYHPHVGGSEEVVRQLSERLARRGHEVTVATSADPARVASSLNGVRIRSFAVTGNEVKGIRGEAQAYTEFLAHAHCDVLLNYAAQTWPTDLAFRLLPELNCARVIAPCGYSGLVGLRRFLYYRYFRRLPDRLRQYDAIVYHAAGYRDKAFGDRHGLGHYAVIPNAVDSAEFERPGPSFREAYGIRTRYLLLAVGNHYWAKGHDRLLAVARRLPHQDMTIALIGRPVQTPGGCWPACCRAAARDGRVRLLDDVPRELVVSAFREADLFLLTSRVEVFPLVILEAMASGTPFVSLPAGNVAELGGGLVVSTVDEMAAQVAHLLADPALRARLGAEGKSLQRSRYDWNCVVDRYEELYCALVARRACGPPCVERGAVDVELGCYGRALPGGPSGGDGRAAPRGDCR